VRIALTHGLVAVWASPTRSARVGARRRHNPRVVSQFAGKATCAASGRRTAHSRENGPADSVRALSRVPRHTGPLAHSPARKPVRLRVRASFGWHTARHKWRQVRAAWSAVTSAFPDSGLSRRRLAAIPVCSRHSRASRVSPPPLARSSTGIRVSQRRRAWRPRRGSRLARLNHWPARAQRRAVGGRAQTRR
jgi:hypothetical protein